MTITPLSSDRQRLSYDVFLGVTEQIIRTEALLSVKLPTFTKAKYVSNCDTDDTQCCIVY